MSGNAGGDVKGQVRKFILDNFMMGSSVDVPDDASFMERHILDSTGFLELVAFVEEIFGIRIHDEEMIPENLDSLSNIERFVQKKQASAAAA